MDYGPLIESLQRDGEETIRSIEEKMKEEAAEIEKEFARKCTLLRQQHEKEQHADSLRRTDDLLAEAHQKADLIRIAALQKLSVRLYRLACSSLPLLRDERYGETFAALTAELPSLSWKVVRVHPGDLEKARKYFTGAEIAGDETISGGMDVQTGDGRVRVINTFEKRLEKAWEDMQSDLLQEDYETR